MARLRWVVGPKRLPSELVGLDGSECEEALTQWRRGSGHGHDLVWCNRPIAYLAVRGALDGVVVIDLDDLEDRKLEGRLEVGVASAGTWGGRRLPGWRLVARRKTRWNIAGWRSLQRTMAAEVDAVVLCSERDRDLSGLPGGVVLPNCYPSVERPAGTAGEAPPTLLMVGLMTYRPNADGAAWFVESVLPLIRAELPDASLRIVGEAGPAVRALETAPGVTVVGRVDGLDVELAEAGAAVVPIRFGGGTRVKILEAWAHRVPVISTTAGAAGLGARDGHDLVLADDALSFARACIRVLADAELRSRVVTNGAARLEAEFTCEGVERRLADELRALVPAEDR